MKIIIFLQFFFTRWHSLFPWKKHELFYHNATPFNRAPVHIHHTFPLIGCERRSSSILPPFHLPSKFLWKAHSLFITLAVAWKARDDWPRWQWWKRMQLLSLFFVLLGRYLSLTTCKPIRVKDNTGRPTTATKYTPKPDYPCMYKLTND